MKGTKGSISVTRLATATFAFGILLAALAASLFATAAHAGYSAGTPLATKYATSVAVDQSTQELYVGSTGGNDRQADFAFKLVVQ